MDSSYSSKDREELSKPFLTSVSIDDQVIDDNNNHDDARKHKVIKHMSLLFGFFVGFFLEAGALSAHTYCQAKMKDISKQEMVALALAWAALIALLPCLALMMLREIVTATHTAERLRFDQSLKELLLCMESYFALGSFGGVVVLALITDLLLGFHHHATISVAFFLSFVGGFWWLQARGWTRSTTTVETCSTTSMNVEQKIRSEPKLVKRMDSVDPCGMKAVEIKHGSLMIV